MIEDVTLPSTAEILYQGMNCLVKNLGVVEAECFVSAVKREHFDYVEWRKKAFEEETLESFLDKAAEYSKKHPIKIQNQNKD